MVSFGEPWPEYNAGVCYRDFVRRSDAGATVIEFYSRKYKNSAPLHGWLQRIKNNQISIDGCVVTDPDTIIREGAELVYHRLPWKEPDAPYLLEILYEDDDVIALNKPSGLQVLPGGLFQQRTVLTQLQRHAGNLEDPGHQESHPVPVHRLGRGTSGLLLCAKTKLSKCHLAAYFADGTSVVGVSRNSDYKPKTTRSITKLYRALASGVITENEVVIDHPIGLVKYPGVAQGFYFDFNEAKISSVPATTGGHISEFSATRMRHQDPYSTSPDFGRFKHYTSSQNIYPRSSSSSYRGYDFEHGMYRNNNISPVPYRSSDHWTTAYPNSYVQQDPYESIRGHGSYKY